MQNYTVDVQALREYIRFLKDYQKRTDLAQRGMRKKLQTAHSAWDDQNYVRTDEAMKEIEGELSKLYASLELTVKSLKEMTDKYDAYLRRRR